MNIWLWFFFMLFAGLLFFSMFNENFQFISANFWSILPSFLFILMVSMVFHYIAIRTFNGSILEALSTAILSFGSVFLFDYMISCMKDDRIYID